MTDITKWQNNINLVIHDLNNIINTINGYAELLSEAETTDNADEIAFFKEKIVSTILKKLPATKVITERLHNIQSEMVS